MSTKSSAGQRPLSPFMLGLYYRFQWTSLLSFTHRLTGVGLAVGTLLLAGWLVALAGGPQSYAAFSAHMSAWYGQVLMFLWTWAAMYHLGNGIRHLFWDIGKGFDLKTAERSGYAVVAFSLVVTAAVWVVAYYV
ncbi:succinate dehydrogenase subunit C [Fontimonas thermophila]|uniref:Succinate dehydrogenase cytochrome b556 subunit n=1 Tax=Fontimonas thermophila TaxID=1076937 RepID=A0A1I2JMC3_9GAMM|nr:succinate dehydrogenase, cytochrome b556 subunit [Fontimonas thermophila]SFF55053.1 succinate dehydrogenase subunit C [Fontimonas thermophila]